MSNGDLQLTLMVRSSNASFIAWYLKKEGVTKLKDFRLAVFIK